MDPTRLNLSSSKVLAVDDNPQSLELLVQVLTGFRLREIIQRRSAEEARVDLGVRSFDLLLIDDAMPTEGGVELTRHIRSQPTLPNFTAPIIIVSGFTPREKVLQARNAGANMVIAKPISAAALLGRIAWIAGNARSFVTCETYTGPDRRFRRAPPPAHLGERRADTQAMISTPERALSQDDIDSLFG